MSESLRDQLLALGLAKRTPPEPQRPVPNKHVKPTQQRPPDSRRDGKRDPRREGKFDPRRGATPGPRHDAKPGGPRPGHRPARPAAPAEPDLAHAYALRAKAEREAQAQAQREAEQKAREKKERKAKLTALLADKSLNDANAEHARHFEHHGKIRRVYVTPEQLVRLNRGELGVVQLAGRYHLVVRECALAAAEITSDALVLLPEPGLDEDGVPADLVW